MRSGYHLSGRRVPSHPTTVVPALGVVHRIIVFISIIGRFAVGLRVVDGTLAADNHLRIGRNNQCRLKPPDAVKRRNKAFFFVQHGFTFVPFTEMNSIGIERIDNAYCQIVNHSRFRTVVIQNKSLVLLEETITLIRRTAAIVDFFDNHLLHVLVGQKERNIFYLRRFQGVFGTIRAGNYHVPRLRKAVYGKGKRSQQGK